MVQNKIPGKQDIIEAANRINPYIHHTPVLTSSYFDQLFSRKIFFKCENFQKAGAFKSRGACNAVFSLTEEELKTGVATHSSGNHAQALARAAMLRNIPAYIVMPENSSRVKVDGVRSYKGIITFCTPTLEARETTLAQVISETGALEIHPYNNVRIIAGQATAAMEVLTDLPDIELVIAPVGGGGLLSGTALAARYFSENTRVIAAEPEMADDAFQSIKAGKFIPSVNPNTIADGLRISLGDITYPIIKEYVDDIVTVKESTIIEAMKLVWERMKIIIEPSSAVPLAALIENKIPPEYHRICLVISGGNVDPTKSPMVNHPEMTQKKGNLFLIPTLLNHTDIDRLFVPYNLQIMETIDEFIVEDTRSAVRFLKLAGFQKPLKEIVFHLYNEHNLGDNIDEMFEGMLLGHHVGLMSEAGLPCVADPGHLVVREAHRRGIKVVPLTGASSLFMALMASGLNGQSFQFHGYLPIKQPFLRKKIKEMEKVARMTQQTQLFIEAPYRNNQLFAELISACDQDTRLCIASEITSENELILTRSVGEWKKVTPPDLHKKPVVFLLGF